MDLDEMFGGFDQEPSQGDRQQKETLNRLNGNEDSQMSDAG
jgi:ATP-dependent RNA helicase DOB1